MWKLLILGSEISIFQFKILKYGEPNGWMIGPRSRPFSFLERKKHMENSFLISTLTKHVYGMELKIWSSPKQTKRKRDEHDKFSQITQHSTCEPLFIYFFFFNLPLWVYFNLLRLHGFPIGKKAEKVDEHTK